MCAHVQNDWGNEVGEKGGSEEDGSGGEMRKGKDL